jgi:hypothetical protein
VIGRHEASRLRNLRASSSINLLGRRTPLHLYLRSAYIPGWFNRKRKLDDDAI